MMSIAVIPSPAEPHCPGDDQLGIGIDSCPRPSVSGLIRCGFRVFYVLALGVEERPYLIALYALGRNTANMSVVVITAGFPRRYYQPVNNVD